MTIWKHSQRDAILLAFSIAQPVVTLELAARWQEASSLHRVGAFAILTLMMFYNVIVVSHLFTHVPWFKSPVSNGLVSLLNSINIGQSVQAYCLKHVRNHHRYSNDPKAADGTTKDTSSTFRDGVDGEHASLLRYALLGALSTIKETAWVQMSVTRLWRVGAHESELLTLAAPSGEKRSRELRQIQLDRIAHFVGLLIFAWMSWDWFLICYVPALYVVFALVNVQNYYEHYGAVPSDRAANSVSHYGRLYNLLTFNDGYHQEHHLCPGAHWSEMPMVREKFKDVLDDGARIISPTPAILGFLHRDRPLLHSRSAARILE
jgi:fatty acid desaturase